MNERDKKSVDHLKSFLKSLGIYKKSVFRMNQVHGNHIEDVDEINSSEKIVKTDETDGLVSSSNVSLVANAADCVPVIFLDKKNKNIGIVHSGWKGTYKEIAKKMVDKFTSKGSKKADILVGIGPSVGVCCYSVDKKRISLFEEKFPDMAGITDKRNGETYLNLSRCIKLQLKRSGITDDNIFDSGICTKDNSSDFYSFRREGGTREFGLFAGVISRV